MTAQIPEILLYDGERLDMCDEPLEVYFKLVGEEHSPFEDLCTANSRGYVGTWEIRENRLYLVDLKGELKTGEPGCVGSLFPGFAERVFAHWFSGRIRAPRGKLLRYLHAGYGSVYEEDVLFDVENGILKSVRVRVNGSATDKAAQDGYQVGGLTVFQRSDGHGAKR